MDSLDDPILPSILTSLAANLARSGNLPSQRRSSIAPSPLSTNGTAADGTRASDATALATGEPGRAGTSGGGSMVAHGDVQDSIKDMQVHTAKSDDRVPQLKGKGKGKGRAREQEEVMLKDVGDGNEVPVRGWSDARDVLKHRLAVLNATLAEKNTSTSLSTADLEMADVKHKLADALSTLKGGAKSLHMPGKEYQQLLFRAVSLMVASPRVDSQALHYLVQLPMASLTPLAVSAGTSAWTWLIRQHPEARNALVAEVAAGWVNSIRAKKGLFNPVLDYADPYTRPIEYSPSDPILLDRDIQKARRIQRPHMDVLKFIADQVQGSKYRGVGLMGSVFRMLMATFSASEKLSTHPIARETRFALVQLGLQILANGKLESLAEIRLREKVYECAGHWFSVRPQWSHSTEFQQSAAEIRLLQDVQALFKADRVRCEGDNTTSAFTSRAPILRVRTRESGGRGLTLQEFSELHGARVRLMMLLLENEVSRLTVWKNPLNENERGGATVGAVERAVKSREWPTLIKQAWRFNPAIAVHMGERFKNSAVQAELTRLVRLEPQRVLGVPEAVRYLIGDHVDPSARAALKWLAIWSPVPPVTALTYFEPRYGNHPLILQYAMRVLEQHPVGLVFFFVPQIVQALRTDELGYVEQFIFETSKISQLFCHQIIWNMKANTYKDDNAEMPDPMKPLLDSMIDRIVTSLSGKAKAFYELEFGFFDEVTSISGKLKPYIKKEKSEKKAKIDEEMAKIKLEVGVYLPSNPDGTVVDIKRDSGRPLQSHAKAPFMATFKVRRERVEVDDGTGTGATKAATEGSETAAQAAPASSAEAKGAAAAGVEEGEEVKKEYDVWQSAIFKVGDDCRQDVLALQIIAMFKNAFWSVGLDLYLFPYRVTATAPGCGVIDVVPNSTSRDEMGRNHVNDLNLYCIQKYGGEETAAYQKARLNFIRSMAAYSVACFILQIKDRHNGNIMIDDDGHIIHIDFGFLFDIGPGGIKFEPNSFKLNREMVALMGGSDSQGFKLFNELTVKAFLAIRPYADQLVDTVHLMLGTGLPSFKGEPTIQRLRDRFMLHLNERRAAEYMMGVINNAHENLRSGLYDRFQHFQKRRIALIPGIPLFIAVLWLLTHPYKVKTTFSYVTRPLWDNLVYPNAPIINLASDALFASHGSDPHYICSLHNGSLPRQAGDARIWDAIIFSQELDMLEIHLAELYDVVDKFIILESTVTYSGQPKDLVFRDNAARFKRFSDKISHHVFSDSDTEHFSYKPGDFAIELQQRSAMTGIIDGLYRTEPAGQGQDTLVLVADVDEIPYDHTLRLIKTCALPPILHLQLTPYVYSFEWVSGDLDSWHIQLHTWIPGESWYRHFSKSTEDYITSAGTHCSFCFPRIEDFQWKMRAYSHNDRLGDHPKALLRTEAIQRAICKGENLFGMLPEAYTWWDLFNRWNGHAARRESAIEAPKLVQAQPERFGYLLPGGCIRQA